jgi:hypothetical protein
MNYTNELIRRIKLRDKIKRRVSRMKSKSTDKTLPL